MTIIITIGPSQNNNNDDDNNSHHWNKVYICQYTADLSSQAYAI